MEIMGKNGGRPVDSRFVSLFRQNQMGNGCQRGNQVYPGLFKMMFYFPNAKSTIWESIENILVLFLLSPSSKSKYIPMYKGQKSNCYPGN